MSRNNRLIIDVGMSEGNDTAFYLAKGFDVVGVEADPALMDHLHRRFAAELADGRLHLLHRAAASSSGETVAFWHDSAEQGHSSLIENRGHSNAKLIQYKVTTINWMDLRAVAGTPYYLKIDIEGGEPDVLSGMIGSEELPLYVSAELSNFRPIELMHAIGYRHFRLINQTIWQNVSLPNPPLEGVFVPRPGAYHWSGAFGRELLGNRWFDFDEIREIYDTIHRLWEYGTMITGWMDCHACLPEAVTSVS